MARISDDELTKLKQDISIQRLAESRGIVLKPHGNDLMGLCPFHDDKEPSLVISPKKNLWHCLGACQCGGSVVDWVMKAEGISFRHAVELLREGYPALAATHATKKNNNSNIAKKVVKENTVRVLPNTLDSDAEDQTLLQRVIDYYHECLKQSPEALAYLESRGLKNAELIDHFKLGFANRTLSYRLPLSNRKTGADIRGRLQTIGIIRQSGHEHFNGSIVIPVINNNLITEVYGRKIRDDLRKGTPAHLYLPGPHQGIFNGVALQHHEEIILCESLIDALTFWVHGFRNVTCSYGIEGFTPDHVAAFKQHNVKRVLIAYDRDDAGERAAQLLAKKLNAESIACYRVQFPKGMDANEYACKLQPALKSLGLVIRKAVWMGDAQGCASVAGGTTPGMEEVEQRMEQLPRMPGATTIPVNDASPNAIASSLAADSSCETNLPATPMPAGATHDIDAEVKDDEVMINLGNRHYRARGLKKNTSQDQLKINLLVMCEDDLHVDTLDIYAAKARTAFIKQAALELTLEEDIIKKDLGKVLLHLESVQEQHLQKDMNTPTHGVVLSDNDKQQALALLKENNLLQRILQDFNDCGIVGEHTNKLVGYLSAVSRKLTKPQAVIIQSSSAAGKSSLMEAVLAFIPDEHKVQYSAMTGQSLFYMGETNLQHKILAIAEEEGVSQASYALKLLQSEGKLTIASTGKDPDSGKHITHEYTVQGPVMLFLTTTASDIDEELLNRCIVLTVDEGREQTRAIHQQQRLSRTLEGLRLQKRKQKLLTLHQNAQRLLRPLSVFNPYAEQLTFIDDCTRTRRDHQKYLTLIDSIALLHQYQRPVKQSMEDGEVIEYVEVTLEDIEVANQLAHEVLGRSLDELPPQTRKLLMHIDVMVNEQCVLQKIDRQDYRFSRKAVRDYMRWSDFQIKTHMKKLEELEYVLVHRGKRGQSFVYELLYDGQGQDGELFLMGLLDIHQLKHPQSNPQNHDYDKKKEHEKVNLEGSSSIEVVSKEHRGSMAQNNANAAKHTGLTTSECEEDENTVIRRESSPSYRTTAWMQEVEQRRERLPNDSLAMIAKGRC